MSLKVPTTRRSPFSVAASSGMVIAFSIGGGVRRAGGAPKEAERDLRQERHREAGRIDRDAEGELEQMEFDAFAQADGGAEDRRVDAQAGLGRGGADAEPRAVVLADGVGVEDEAEFRRVGEEFADERVAVRPGPHRVGLGVAWREGLEGGVDVRDRCERIVAGGVPEEADRAVAEAAVEARFLGGEVHVDDAEPTAALDAFPGVVAGALEVDPGVVRERCVERG